MASAKVLLLNDNKTPMEFVVLVLEELFGKTRDDAIRLVLNIDHDGSGVCGVYAPSQAWNIAERVTQLARLNQFPLRCLVEPDEANLGQSANA
jgi:ATP-dependent Clp protease adaptor protein ClpS